MAEASELMADNSAMLSALQQLQSPAATGRPETPLVQQAPAPAVGE